MNLSIGTNVYVENNTLGFLSSAAFVNFNASARLKFFGLNWTNATAQFCDGNNANPSNCLSCNSAINCSYNNATGIMLVNVTSFSNYTTNGTAVAAAESPTSVRDLNNFTEDFADALNNSFFTNYTDANTDLGLSSGSLRINASLAGVAESRTGFIYTSQNVSDNDFIVSTFIDVSNIVLTTAAWYEAGITLHNQSDASSLDADVMCNVGNDTAGEYTLYFYNETYASESSKSVATSSLSGNLTLTYNSTSNIYNCSFGSDSLSGVVIGLSSDFGVGLFGTLGNDGSATGVLDVTFDDWQFTNSSMEHAVVAAETTYLAAFNDTFDGVTINTTRYTTDSDGLSGEQNDKIIVNGTDTTGGNYYQLMVNYTNMDYINMSSSFYITVDVNVTNTSAITNAADGISDYRLYIDEPTYTDVFAMCGVFINQTGNYLSGVDQDTTTVAVSTTAGNLVMAYNATSYNYTCYFDGESITSLNGSSVTGDYFPDSFVDAYYTSVNTTFDTFNFTYGDYVVEEAAATDNYPNVTLISPVANYINDTAATTSINFSCNVTDDYQLVNISLYLTNSTNESFTLNQTTGITGTFNSTNWTLELSTGNYTWGCLAYDNASQSNWSAANRTILLNYTTPAADDYPYWSANSTNVVSTYSSTTESQFNITWQDGTNVSIVYLESNYSGTATNYSMDNITASIYNYSAILPAGTFYWRSYANDSANQWNETTQWNLTIAQASSEVNTTINNSESNITIDKDTTIDLNCTLITGESSIYLYNNGSLINSGTSPIGNSTLFSSEGLYNITCSYPSTQNYSASSETYWLTVSNTIPTLTQPAITPATAYTNNTLTANTTYADADNEAGTVYFFWYVDRVNVYNETNSSISSGTTVITTLASTYFNKTNAVNLSVYANDGTNDSTIVWSSNTITITNLAPTFDEDLTAQTVNYGQAFTYDINCSDEDDDALTYYDNTSLFNIATSTGIITDTPVEAEMGAYSINISCGDGTTNTSQTFTYNITDGTAPTVRITAPVTLISATSTLLNATTDENSTCYYKNNTAGYAAMFTTGNTTHSQNITGLALGNNLYSVQCNDSYANSATKTTYVLRTSVVANETNITSLTFVGNSTNTSNILTNLNLTINISTGLSNVAISGSEFSSNPEQETFAITSYTVTEFKFYTIDAPEISDYINKITLLFNYNETEVLAAGIAEADLGVFYYNSATDLWIEESEVYVDTTANTIEANVTHLSTFVLGQATAVPAAEEAAAAASAGSGGSAWGLCGDGLCNNGLTCSNCPEDCGACPVEDVVEETTEEATEEIIEELVTETTGPETVKAGKLPFFGNAIAFAGDFKDLVSENALAFNISGGVIILLLIIFIIGKVMPRRKAAIVKRSSPKSDLLLLKKPSSKETPRIRAKPLKRYKRVTENPNKKKQPSKNHHKKKHPKRKHSKVSKHKVKHKKK